MSDPDASEASRAMNRARWGNAAACRAAATVIERRDELPDALRDEVVRSLSAAEDSEAGK